MRLLTCYPPYAQLLALGLKEWETRPKPASYSGLVAIHSGKSHEYMQQIEQWRVAPPNAEAVVFIEQLDTAIREAHARDSTTPTITQMQYGVIVGVGELTDSRPVEWIHDLSVRERAFGIFTPGRFGWRITNARHLLHPIPAIGYQCLWKMPQHLIDRVLSEAV